MSKLKLVHLFAGVGSPEMALKRLKDVDKRGYTFPEKMYKRHSRRKP